MYILLRFLEEVVFITTLGRITMDGEEKGRSCVKQRSKICIIDIENLNW